MRKFFLISLLVLSSIFINFCYGGFIQDKREKAIKRMRKEKIELEKEREELRKNARLNSQQKLTVSNNRKMTVLIIGGVGWGCLIIFALRGEPRKRA